MICNIQKDFVYIEIPKILFNYRKINELFEPYIKKGIHFDLKTNNGKIIITIEAPNANNIIREVFSKYHNIPINFKFNYNYDFKNSKKPLISCIVLLNMNDFFVRDLTIPSIIFNSKNTPIEIIVVNNGKTNFKYKNIKVIKSEFYNIPKAYNKAASIAKGDYVAFFHDDCFLSDDDWINKCIYNLTDEVIAVGPEYHKFRDNEDYLLRKETDLANEFKEDSKGFLKEVPLVMEKNKFFEVGGFPEREILGQEDIFLHKNILKSGKRNLKVDVKNYHFEGISTLLLFSNYNKLLKTLCSNFIFSKNEILALIHNGLDVIIGEKMKYCTFLYKNNYYDSEMSVFCDNISTFSDENDLDYLVNFKDESMKMKKLMDGFAKVFTTIRDIKCLDILDNFVDFHELLYKYVMNKSEERNY